MLVLHLHALRRAAELLSRPYRGRGKKLAKTLIPNCFAMRFSPFYSGFSRKSRRQTKLPAAALLLHSVGADHFSAVSDELHKSDQVENDTYDEKAEDDDDRGYFLLQQIHAEEGEQQSRKSGNQRVQVVLKSGYLGGIHGHA